MRVQPPCDTLTLKKKMLSPWPTEQNFYTHKILKMLSPWPTEVCKMVILKAICVRKDWCLCCLQTHVHHIGQFIVLYQGAKLYCATQSVLAAGHRHLYHLYSFCYSNACLVFNFLECYNLKSYSNSFFCSFMFTSLRSI